MSMQEIEEGKKVIKKILMVKASDKKLLIEKFSWVPIDFDKREFKIEYEINRKEYRFTISREDLTDCINDKSVRKKLSNQIEIQLKEN